MGKKECNREQVGGKTYGQGGVAFYFSGLIQKKEKNSCMSLKLEFMFQYVFQMEELKLF